MSDPFNFVIARFSPGKKSLCCYMIQNGEVMFGTTAEAENVRQYVERRDPAFKANPWRVVKIDLPN